MYEANVDDVGYRLVAIYTPVREDGVEGQSISVSTEPIAVGKMKFFILLTSGNICANTYVCPVLPCNKKIKIIFLIIFKIKNVIKFTKYIFK